MRRGSTAAKPTPRRRPGGASARALVEAILDASALLLERDGIEGLTTNAVARVAGVSVGSLYQYFPDKRAIIAELARRMERSGRDFAAMQLDWMAGVDLRHAAWRIAGLAADPAFGSLRVRRALLREVPRGWIHEVTKDADATLETLLAAFLRVRQDEIRSDASPEELAFVVYHAFDGVVEGTILLDPALLESGELEEELFHLAWRYVAPVGAALSPPDAPRARAAIRDAAPDGSVRARLDDEPSHRRPIGRRALPGTTRGRATRDAILAAAARVLARDGLAKTSARRIASEAGVVPAALYRHFPNIESIVSELGFEEERRMREAMAGAVSSLADIESRRAIEALVRIYAAPAGEDRRRRTVLFRELPRRWAEEASEETQRMARRELARALGSRGALVRSGDAERMAFVGCRAVEGVVEAALLRGLPWSETDHFVSELTELVWRYLRADPA